jgi:hypothetical protein
LERDQRVCVRHRRDTARTWALTRAPTERGGVLVNTRTIAIVALIIAVIVLLLLLL